MTRIVVFAIFLTTVLVLGSERRVMGQAQPNKSAGALLKAGKPAAGKKKNEPDWQRMYGPDGGDNLSYLERTARISDELERFRDDPFWSDGLKQMLGTEYSCLGRYQQALECFDRHAGPKKKAGKLTTADEYEPLDAIAAILELADKQQVIMINEAHHVSMHRAFTLQLLEGLYQKGFRYFAAETLSKGDNALQTRGYPTRRTGGYTVEPVYADLVRTALKLGYHVIPYECEESPQPDRNDPTPAMQVREQGQAKNLQERILEKDPTAKIIVHAGYAHICKSLDGHRKGELKWMALAFQELTGIEPFSIDQTEMSEMNKPENEKPDYRFAVEKSLVKDRPVVLRDKEANSYFVCTANGLMYDLSVIHPRSHYENGRPSWLEMGGRRTPHTVKTDARPPEGKSYLAQAFYAAEPGPEAIPIDQMVYGGDDPPPTLWLPTGEFTIRIVDEKANIIEEQPALSR